MQLYVITGDKKDEERVGKSEKQEKSAASKMTFDPDVFTMDTRETQKEENVTTMEKATEGKPAQEENETMGKGKSAMSENESETNGKGKSRLTKNESETIPKKRKQENADTTKPEDGQGESGPAGDCNANSAGENMAEEDEHESPNYKVQSGES